MVLSKKPLLLKNLGIYGTNGSHKGMRFTLLKEAEDLAAYTFPEPYAFDYTADEYKTRQAFTFDEDGYSDAIHWINEQYTSRLSEWTEALRESPLNAKTRKKDNQV